MGIMDDAVFDKYTLKQSLQQKHYRNVTSFLERTEIVMNYIGVCPTYVFIPV